MDSDDASRNYYFDNTAFVFKKRHGSLDGPKEILQLTNKTGKVLSTFNSESQLSVYSSR